MNTSRALVSLLLASVAVSVAPFGCSQAGTSHPAITGQGGDGAGAGTTGSAGTGSPAGSAGTTGSAGTIGAGGGGGERTCGLQMFDMERKPAEVLLLLDRSASMADPPDGATTTTPKWDLVVPAVNQVVTSSDAALSWALKVFPEGTGSECVAGNVTSKVDVPMAPMNAAAVVAGVNMTPDTGNGTPTGDAVNAAVDYLTKLPDTNTKYILLATDGEPSCAGTTKDSTAARNLAVTAVTNAAAAGIHTFVVGVATTKTSATSVLNMLADAGKEPRNDPRPLANHFYLGSTQAELQTALSVITGQVSSCIFQLNPPPPVLNNPAKLGVYFGPNMTKVPYDATMTNGWAYLNAQDTAVQVYGSWCDQIQTTGANMAKIIFGCATIDVP